MLKLYIRTGWGLIFLILFSFSLVGRAVRDYDLDYALVMLISLYSAPLLFIFKTHIFDRTWLPAFFWAIVLLSLIGFKSEVDTNPTIQCLMFFIPTLSLMSRIRSIPTKLYLKSVVYFTLGCFLGLLPYISEIIIALTTSNERARFHSFFSIAICFPIVTILLSGLLTSKVKTIFLFFCLVIFSGAAAHRSLYLAFLVQLVYWAYINGNIKSLIRPLVGLLLGGGIMIFTNFGQIIIQKFLDSTSGNDGNTESRLFYYSEILKNSFHDFFGVGFGSYFKYGVDSKGELVAYALQHNSYFSYLYFLGWVPFFFVVYWKSKLYLSVAKNDNILIKMLSTALVGMSFFAILNVYLEQPIFGFCYWLLFGFLIREKYYGKKCF